MEPPQLEAAQLVSTIASPADIYDVTYYGDSREIKPVPLCCPNCDPQCQKRPLRTVKPWDSRLRIELGSHGLQDLHLADIPVSCRKCRLLFPFAVSLAAPYVAPPEAHLTRADTLMLKCPGCVAQGKTGILQVVMRYDKRLRISNTGRAFDALHLADIPLTCAPCHRRIFFVMSLAPPHIKSVDKLALS